MYQPKTEGFEIVDLPDGTQGKKWENGSVTRMNGTLVYPADNAGKIVTSEQAREMAAKRHEARRETIEKYVQAEAAKHVKATGAFSTDDALGVLAAARARVALNDEGRAGNDAAKLIFMLLEAMPDSKKNEQRIVHQHQLSEKTVEVLKELARLRNDPDLDYLEADYADG